MAILFTCSVSHVACLSVVCVAISLGADVIEADARGWSRPKQQLIAARSRLGAVLCLKRRTDALLGKRRGMDRVVDEPGPVIVPEVMIRVIRIKPKC